MSPSASHISSQLRQLIYYHLDNNLIRNALFLAGRLHAFEPRSPEASYLLALCHLHSGQVKAAWEYSRSSRGTHIGCAYVFAQACLELGKYIEGITALEKIRSLWISRNTWNKHSETRRQHLPDAAAIFCLQGKLWHAHKDLHKAVDAYVEALKLNPFLWDAFLGLCETGANIRVPNIYKLSPEMLAMISAAPSSEYSPTFEKPPTSAPLQVQPNANHNVDPFVSLHSRVDNSSGYGSSALWEKLNGSSVSVSSINAQSTEGMETPVAQSEADEFRMGGGSGADPSWDPPLAPARKTRTIQPRGLDYGADPPPKMRAAAMKSRTRTRADAEDSTAAQAVREASAPAIGIGERKRTVSGQVAHTSGLQPPEPGAPQRRSVRLFNQIRPTTSKFSTAAGALGSKEGREIKKVKAPGVKSRTVSGSTMGRVVSGNRKPAGEGTEGEGKEGRVTSGSTVNGATSGPTQKATLTDKTKDIESLSWILDLFSKLAGGYSALSSYKCQEAIQMFNSLPQSQRETPWVLSQMGRAYYEQAMYSDSEKYFVKVKAIAPSRLDDMEVYSTVLWHLKNEVELAYLAHELMEVDRLSPQAWCAIGNSFSLQNDHDQAIKCFKRATQLDPKFAYAFTLQGHEYVSNEEFDKALDAYRHGISADSRHYNAWYGLARVYEKMGKYKFAEQHYRTASTINPMNAVLACCLGLILERVGNQRAALQQYGRACSLAPESVVARFRKARTLMKLHELQLAHTELKILKDMAPDEANVHYLLGKLYKLLHDKANAIKHFTTALNLDPKAAQYIKDAMESLESPDDDDEDMT
ncbi:hypothetical protein AJ80_02236 [Polytolypa hystricis UAMH7299]|uniref:Protein bimA n=1 Tax=Polytolypa hystricis (strain UAMH7299) TaxID=1447883 RepID=A0A2B7YR32_POLH7|nr:hypothetical protein AJ80_02236 [Polytolypa hystricis UAMH7299]